MSKIIIDKQVLEDWIKYIDTFPLYPEDRIKLKSILQQSEEYNENEVIEFAEWLRDWEYVKHSKQWYRGIEFVNSEKALFKLYEHERNIKK